MFQKGTSIYISLLLIGVKSQDYYTHQSFPQNNKLNVQTPNVETTYQELKYIQYNKQIPDYYPQYDSTPEQQQVTNQHQNSYKENQNRYVLMSPQPAPVNEETCNNDPQEIQYSYQIPKQKYKANNPQLVEYYNQNQQQPIQYQRPSVQNQEYLKQDSVQIDQNQQYQITNYERSWQLNSQAVDTQRKFTLNKPSQYAETYEDKKPEGLSAYKSDEFEGDYQYKLNLQDKGASNYDAVSPHLQPPPNQQHQYY